MKHLRTIAPIVLAWIIIGVIGSLVGRVMQHFAKQSVLKNLDVVMQEVWSEEKTTVASSTNRITYALPEDILDKSKYLQIDTPVPTGGGAWTWTKTNWVRDYWYDTNEEHELVLPEGQFIISKGVTICYITNLLDWTTITNHFTNDGGGGHFRFSWFEPKKKSP